MKKKYIIIAGGALIVILALFFWNKNKAPTVTYREIKVSRGNLESTIQSTGTVQPENRLEIKPPIAGRVEQVLVDEGDAVKRGQILIWMSSTERAALLDAAHARGPQELKKWEDFYKATPVLAPIDGHVILRSIETGQTFTTQDPVLVLSDRLTIEAQVDETDIAQIRLQQKSEVTLDAYPNEAIPAHVARIAYEAKTVNNVTTYLVSVLPESIPDFVRSGMTANISFRIDSRENVVFVPTEAIKNKDGQATVLLKSDKQKNPLETPVSLGLNDGKKAEILSGITEGDIVLVPQLNKTNRAASGTNPFSPARPPRAGR